MKYGTSHIVVRGVRLILVVMLASLLVGFVIVFARHLSSAVRAAPIEPPEGYPKLNLSMKMVSPELANVGGETLTYTIEIVNTGAYTASDVVLADLIPANTSYNGDATASTGEAPNVTNGLLTWTGEVGFDASVFVSFSVDVTPTAYTGIITNTAVISHSLIPQPVRVSAETLVTDQPILKIEKTSSPDKPGANKPLTYNLKVTNIGQVASGLPIIVSDVVPADTTFNSSPDGQEAEGVVTWERTVNLATGESTLFSFTVDVGDVPSGTVLTNQDYEVSNTDLGTAYGAVYTTTVVDPILYIAKLTDPDPPGSNREMTYTLTVLNMGSLATDLEIIDVLPAGVEFRRVDNGYFNDPQVIWTLPQLGTGEFAQFSFVVYVPDIAELAIENDSYQVCSDEGVCQVGRPLSSLVKGPTFTADLWLDPVAKKPGGGTGPVTPTLVLRNLGPGNALDAMALIYFQRISVSFEDLVQDPPVGVFYNGPDCGEKCDSYLWVGDLGVGQPVTITALGESTQGGEEGTHYTTTVVITDVLGSYVTQPFTGTVTGTITHLANLIPTKSAPTVAAIGFPMTYTIQVYNSGLSTDDPPYPVLTETIPASTTLLSVSDGGLSYDLGGRTVISWTLPAMSPGDRFYRSFSVLLDSDLLSGTQIVNSDYRTLWHNVEVTGVLSNTGVPVTTTVRELGLIDSFKSVTPTQVTPGPDRLLTYTLHVVNSSPVALYGVKLYDIFPWQHSTYQRDAVATSGQVISDIVSLDWEGDVAAFSTELITFSVLVDADYQGAITNTATITHPSLREPFPITAVAQVTNKPVLVISKWASPDPVGLGEELLYTIRVQNLGQLASGVVVSDSLPTNTVFVPGSATAGGQLVGDRLEWFFTGLAPGEVQTLSFVVQVLGGKQVVNDAYGVTCAEGVTAHGEPVYTDVRQRHVYLPLVQR